MLLFVTNIRNSIELILNAAKRSETGTQVHSAKERESQQALEGHSTPSSVLSYLRHGYCHNKQ